MKSWRSLVSGPNCPLESQHARLEMPSCPHDYRWHSWNNATQMPAIIVRLTGPMSVMFGLTFAISSRQRSKHVVYWVDGTISCSFSFSTERNSQSYLSPLWW